MQIKIDQIKIGLVIPIYNLEWVERCISSIIRSGYPENAIICVVNDGNNAIRENLTTKYRNNPQIVIVNLEENHRFAGANNIGWTYLTHSYPNIEFLGTLNDDTICRMGWIDALLHLIQSNSGIGMVGPIQEYRGKGILKQLQIKTVATWHLGDWNNPMIVSQTSISEDKEVDVIGGFCFIGRRDALEEVGMFSIEYRNSCEDVDLSMKLRKAGYKLMVSHKAKVFHFGGMSRYLPGADTNIDYSHRLLKEKWGL